MLHSLKNKNSPPNILTIPPSNNLNTHSYEPNSGLTIYYYNGAPFGFKSSWIYTPKKEIFAFTAGNSTNENTPNDYSNDVMSPVFNLCLKNSN